MVAMIGLAFGVLLVATLGAAGLARDTASDNAVSDLERQAPEIAAELQRLGQGLRVAARSPTDAGAVRTQAVRRACRLVAATMRISDGGLVVVDADGTLEDGIGDLFGSPCPARDTVPGLPDGLEAADLDTRELLAGESSSGVAGDTAYVTVPLDPVAGRLPVLIVTQHVESRPLGQAGGWFVVTSAIALAVAAGVAALLARRLTRPIAAMQATAGAIAAGDLGARVSVDRLPDDELGSLARSIDTMADELQTAQGHERAFLLGISHDLRTPLTSIKGYAEAMADGVITSPPDRARAAEVIASEAHRLERLVADLLDLARLDAREFSLEPQRIDARRIVADVVAGFEPTAREWDVTMALTPGEPIEIEADPQRLAQIVANLVENALKYATTTVRVDVDESDPAVEILVDDDGPGVPAEERERVFERLYTARTTPGRKVGTGIGLAVVHELAGAMGGSARCEPLEGGGTRFVVRLPRRGAPRPSR